MAEKETNPLTDMLADIDSFLGWSKMSTSRKFGALFWVYFFGGLIFQSVRAINEYRYDGPSTTFWIGGLILLVASEFFKNQEAHALKKAI